MRTRPLTAATLLLGVVASLLTAAQPAHAATGFHIRDGKLYDASDRPFVMRGVNHAHTWYGDRTAKALSDIKALGANTVRIVLGTGDRWARNGTEDVARVVSQCRQNRLICVLEAHDTTGYGESGEAVSLSRAADYWIGVKDALVGEEKYTIVNVGNEPYGNNNPGGWTSDTSAAITKLRDAGLNHTLMVDGPNWGQDWSFTMRDNADRVFRGDPQRNTVFSVHMYGVFDTSGEVDSYLRRFTDAGLPIVVGEFGDRHSDGDPSEDAIMSTAQSLGVGYLGWSWSGNGGGVEYLDMTTGFDAGKLTSWGRRVFDGANGIKQTAREAGVFGGDGDTQAPSAPGAPTASDVTSTGARLSWSAATDDTGVAAYDVVRLDGTTERTMTSTRGTSAGLTGLSPSTRYEFAVRARDAAGNRSGRSPSVTLTTKAGGGGDPSGACAVDYRISDWGSTFNADVTVHNRGSERVKGWRLEFSFPGNQTLDSIWNAKGTQSGSRMTVTNESWTETIPAGGSVSFGLSGSSSGGNGAPRTFSLNGQPCSAD